MAQKTIPDFRRAAQQRLESADVLFRAQRNLDSMYLAGYAVECALKALLINATPMSKRAAAFAKHCRGERGHNLESLKASLKLLRYNMPVDVAAAFRRVRTWSTDLRYEVGFKSTAEAEEFLRAVRCTIDWTNKCLN